MNQKRKCIIHYKGQKHYTKIKDISQGNEKWVAKEVRIKQGGENNHKKQCDMIPNKIKKCEMVYIWPLATKRFC